jgi:hypothetical protein
MQHWNTLDEKGDKQWTRSRSMDELAFAEHQMDGKEQQAVGQGDELGKGDQVGRKVESGTH